ncbi:unnamed protein product [Diamesa serratosioi]
MHFKGIFIVVLIVLFGSIDTTPVDLESSEEQTPENQIEQSDVQRGILDGVIPTTTAAPAAGGGLGGLGGLGTNVGNAGPMLIIGGFQAIVTKFDPSMIGKIPGMPALPNLG